MEVKLCLTQVHNRTPSFVEPDVAHVVFKGFSLFNSKATARIWYYRNFEYLGQAFPLRSG